MPALDFVTNSIRDDGVLPNIISLASFTGHAMQNLTSHAMPKDSHTTSNIITTEIKKIGQNWAEYICGLIMEE